MTRSTDSTAAIAAGILSFYVSTLSRLWVLLAAVAMLGFWVPLSASAQIVINEIMQNPSVVSDMAGEWFEVHNPAAMAIDMDGWTIRDNGSESHVIFNGGPLLVPGGGFLVFGRNGDPMNNGSLSVDYVFSGIELANSDDELVLLDTGVNEIDRVEWDGGPLFPDPTGASMSLIDPMLDNNVGANWCTASTPFGAGDLGTPGAGNDCAVEPPVFDLVVEWAWTSSASSPWPDHLNVMTTPGVIDLNGDDVPDLVFGTTNLSDGGTVLVGVLRALNGADGSELFTVTSPMISTTMSVAVGDIDLDSLPEILASDASGTRLIAFEHDGSLKWISSSAIANVKWGAPSIADLDGDGIPEIVIGRQVLDNLGDLQWTGTGGSGGQGAGPLSLVADLDLNGTPEVVAGNTAYSTDGSFLWQNGTLLDGYNAVGNFDADDFAEVVLVSNGTITLLEGESGTVKWGPMPIPGGGSGGPPTVADFDGDGVVEIGVAGASRYAVFETDGSLKWSRAIQDFGSGRTGSSVFDFEGDGSAEVVYSDERNLQIYDGSTGDLLFDVPLSSCTFHEYPLVADIDADGNAEVVAVANNNCGLGPQQGIYVYGNASENWVAARGLWNQHTYHITNINDDGSIPATEPINWLQPGMNNYRSQGATSAPDTDDDGVPDSGDNCLTVSNVDQRDTDTDGIGNVCDPDVAAPNDCNVNFLDLNVYRDNFFQPGDLDTDNNGDGQTNFLDLNIVRSFFFGPPGPSANGCN